MDKELLELEKMIINLQISEDDDIDTFKINTDTNMNEASSSTTTAEFGSMNRRQQVPRNQIVTYEKKNTNDTQTMAIPSIWLNIDNVFDIIEKLEVWSKAVTLYIAERKSSQADAFEIITRLFTGNVDSWWTGLSDEVQEVIRRVFIAQTDIPKAMIKLVDYILEQFEGSNYINRTLDAAKITRSQNLENLMRLLYSTSAEKLEMLKGKAKYNMIYK